MILVTGGLGFIGSHTVAALLKAGHDVVATQFRTSRIPSFLADSVGKKLHIESLDASSPHATIEVAQRRKIDSIVHLMVTPLGRVSPGEDYRLNMSGLINILEAGRAVGAKRISLASSSSIYGGVAKGPFREDMELRMRGAHQTEAYKKAFEILGQHYGERTGIEIACLRIGNVWGPLYHSMNNLASRLAHAAIKNQPGPLPRPNGRPDFAGDALDAIYVRDCADGIARVHGAAKLDHAVYNIGGGRAVTGADFVAAIKKAVPGMSVTLQEGSGPDNRGENPVMDLSRVAALGYRPTFGVEDGMADYLAWLRAGNAF